LLLVHLQLESLLLCGRQLLLQGQHIAVYSWNWGSCCCRHDIVLTML
jgi:hypothetical protein